MIKYTAQQKLAIENTGGPLLVSAAAGSGKTRVLVERLLHRVFSAEACCDIDEFLIITYTNAAASELKARILDTIYERIAADPENRRLRRQADICGRAEISTIHGFCSRIIKENAHLLDLNPNFRVVDETESDTLKSELLSDMIEEAYSSMDPGFLSLADTMGAGRDDKKLISIIIDAHEKLLSHPYPEKWVKEHMERLEPSSVTDLAETPWGRVIINKIRGYSEYAEGCIRGLLDEADTDDALEKSCGPSLRSTYEGILALRASLDCGWDAVRAALNIEFPRTKPLRGAEYDGVKSIRSSVKEGLKKLCELMRDDAERSAADLRKVVPEIKSLYSFVLEFDRRFRELKKKKGVIDFHDQEHLALKLLVDPDSLSPTETARNISKRYVEIMVDEYQDVNEIQEMIFGAVSKDGKNVFMVGDVKQSIYKFRLADPTIFIKKYTEYCDADNAKDGEGRKILLSDNFRSRKGILDGTNFVLGSEMSRELGDLDYTEREALKYGAKDYADSDEPEIELAVLNMKSDDDGNNEDGEAPDRVEAEAEYAAQRLRELMRSFKVQEKSGTRPLKYGDVAVLMRSPSARAQTWVDTLSRYGIPAKFGSESGFFDTPEISMAMAFAAIIDNPRQDIPLITVLRSPVYGFTSDELANIRSADTKSDFFAAAETYSENSEKLQRFFSEIREFREDSEELPADELLWKVFSKTGFFAAVSAMPDGEKRLRNVMRLIEAARKIEASGYKGVYGFVKYVNTMMEQGKSLAFDDSGERADAVTIMSVHKSKGLEFPIVFFADTARQFNDSDARAPLLIHSELGIGADVVDLKRRIQYPTISKKAIRLAIRKEGLSEELRVLYVAMTRAKEKLIILASYSDAENALGNIPDTSLPVPPAVLENARSFADFILLSALRRPESEKIRFSRVNAPVITDDKAWKVSLVDASGLGEEEGENYGEAALPEVSGEELAIVTDRIEAKYPFADASLIPSKLTATELKGGFSDAETHEDAEEIKKPQIMLKPPKRPEFGNKKRTLTSAQKGTAVHLVMQYADFEKAKTEKGASVEIERLRLMGNLTDEEAAAVNPKLISDFFSTETGKLILSADKVRRELKFSVLADSDLFPRYAGGEKLLLQGVVDCVCEKDGKLTIIDYKTDFVTESTVDERAEYYRGQLETYAYAMEKILKKPVAGKIVHFLTAGIARRL